MMPVTPLLSGISDFCRQDVWLGDDITVNSPHAYAAQDYPYDIPTINFCTQEKNVGLHGRRKLLSSDFNQNFNLPPSFSKSPQNLIS
jgi:hypothetical protein